MPYRWREATLSEPAELMLWPHRSLPRRGFVLFLGLTAALLAVPLLSQLGHPGLWVMLPFLLAALAGIWVALERSYRDGAVVETLTLTPDSLTLVRQARGQPVQTWQANPYWVRARIYPSGGRVPQYLTLTGAEREVELGAFLTEGERQALKADLDRRLGQLGQAGG